MRRLGFALALVGSGCGGGGVQTVAARDTGEGRTTESGEFDGGASGSLTSAGSSASSGWSSGAGTAGMADLPPDCGGARYVLETYPLAPVVIVDTSAAAALSFDHDNDLNTAMRTPWSITQELMGEMLGEMNAVNLATDIHPGLVAAVGNSATPCAPDFETFVPALHSRSELVSWASEPHQLAGGSVMSATHDAASSLPDLSPVLPNFLLIFMAGPPGCFEGDPERFDPDFALRLYGLLNGFRYTIVIRVGPEQGNTGSNRDFIADDVDLGAYWANFPVSLYGYDELEPGSWRPLLYPNAGAGSCYVELDQPPNTPPDDIDQVSTVYVMGVPYHHIEVSATQCWAGDYDGYIWTIPRREILLCGAACQEFSAFNQPPWPQTGGAVDIDIPYACPENSDEG